jgi:hypothetical protein
MTVLTGRGEFDREPIEAVNFGDGDMAPAWCAVEVADV